jgi:DNA repair protein RecN (Recombination protein N)
MARAWQDLGEARRAVEAAEAEASGAERLTEDLEAIAARVEAVAPAPGEEAALRAERERLRHADVLAAAAAGAAALLNPEEGEGAQALAARAERLLRPAEDLDERLATTGDELREALVRLEEAAHTLHAYASAVDHDPRRLDAVEERLERLDDLVRRHGSLDAALAAAGAARERLERLAHRDDDLRALRSRLADAEAEAATAAAALTEARQAGSGPFAAAIERQLGDLGMADAGVEVRLERREAGPSGADEVALLVAPNPGLPPGPVRQIASGGELSRITLAIRVAAHEREGGGTLVFDEIDAGVGGRTARAVADKLVALAATEQLICITHLPQIAARADRHFRVVKEAGDPTVTRIDELDEAAAEDELARMLGAEEGSAEALQLARSLRARPR